MIKWIIEFSTILTLIQGVSSQQKMPDYTYELVENSPVNTSFGNLIQDLGLTHERLNMSSITFQLFPSRQEAKRHFKIERKSDQLWTLTVISNFDREEECVRHHQGQYCRCNLTGDECFIELSMAIDPLKETMRLFKIRIDILDENDNVPIFKWTGNQTFTVEFSESDNVGSVRRLPIAEDVDGPRNNGINYYFKESNLMDSFSLEYGGDKNSLELVLLKELDREETANYTLTLIAQDEKNPIFITSLPLRVIVVDVNDCQPKFRHFPNNEAVLRIPEDISIGSNLIDLTADDCDVGNNARITHEIIDEKFKKIFEVDPKTFMLKVKSTLDREEMPEEFEFKVVIRDHGSPIMLRDTLIVKVTLIDVNDNSPEITLTEDLDIGYQQIPFKLNADLYRKNKILPKSEVIKFPVHAEIKENREIGKIITFITVKDRDYGQNGTASCYITNEYVYPQPRPRSPFVTDDLRLFENLNSFTINQVELLEDYLNVLSKESDKVKVYRLQTKTKFDAEFISDLIIEVICEDSCNIVHDCKRTSSRWLRIKITDSNDYMPYLEGVSLISPPNIITFKDYNQTIRRLNHEIIKTDGIQLSIIESAPIATKLFKFIATDRDVGIYGSLSFYFNETRLNNSGPFEISRDSGDVILREPLDRETNDHYELNVLVVDKALDNSENEPCYSINFRVDIEILDVNDERPDIYLVLKSNYDHDVILKPTNQTAIINVPDNATENTDIYPKFYITDKDLNSDIKVNMLMMKDDGSVKILSNPFDLINVKGYQGSFNQENHYYSLILKRPLDPEAGNKYKFRIICADSDDHQMISHTSSIDLTVNVLGDYENAKSRHLLKNNFFYVSTKANASDHLFQLQSRQEDTSNVKYRIVETKCDHFPEKLNLFHIPNNLYGEVILTKKIDKRLIGSCTLIIEMTDNSQTSLDTITVKITDKLITNPYNEIVNDLPYASDRDGNRPNDKSMSLGSLYPGGKEPTFDILPSIENKSHFFQMTIVIVFSVILLSGVILLVIGFVLTMNLCQKYKKRVKSNGGNATCPTSRKIITQNYDNQNPLESMSLSSYNYNASVINMPIFHEIHSPNLNNPRQCFSPVLSHHSNGANTLQLHQQSHLVSESNFFPEVGLIHRKVDCNNPMNTYQPCRFDYALEEMSHITTSANKGNLIQCQTFKPDHAYQDECQSPQVIGKTASDIRYTTSSCFDNQDSDSGHGQGTDQSSNLATSSDHFSHSNRQTYNLIV